MTCRAMVLKQAPLRSVPLEESSVRQNSRVGSNCWREYTLQSRSPAASVALRESAAAKPPPAGLALGPQTRIQVPERSKCPAIVNSRHCSAASHWPSKRLQPLSPAVRLRAQTPYMGGRPQAASLVQGLRPRNAPLQNHASPTVCLHRNVTAGEHGGDCAPAASQTA